MELPYIQDIVGNKKEAPGAPLPKQEKDIAFIVKRYINNEQESVCLLYYDESSKEIIKGHTYAKKTNRGLASQ